MQESTDKRSALLVVESYPSATSTEDKANSTLDDPDEGQDGEDKRGPVDETRGSLVSEDGPKGPGDGNRSGEITFRCRESVGGSSTLEEEPEQSELDVLILTDRHLQGEEDKDFGPDTCGVIQTAHAESIECSDDDEDGSPTMVEREWQMNE